MLQAELGDLNTGADAMEQSTRRMMQILSEIARTAVVLQSCAEGDLQQPISELSGTLEQTAYLLSVMKQLSNVLRLSEHQYELTANTVLIRCENSCFADREKRFRTVNLADVRQKMEGVRFEKGDIDGTDCN